MTFNAGTLLFTASLAIHFMAFRRMNLRESRHVAVAPGQGSSGPFHHLVAKYTIVMVGGLLLALAWQLMVHYCDVPEVLTGRHLWFLYGILSFWLAIRLYDGVGIMTRYLDAGCLVSAVNVWTALRACMVFDAIWVIQAWIVVNVLKVLEKHSVISLQGLKKTAVAGLSWTVGQCPPLADLGAMMARGFDAVYAWLANGEFTLCYLGALGVLYAVQAIVRFVWVDMPFEYDLS